MTFSEKRPNQISLRFLPPDGHLALSSGVDQVATVWDTVTGRPVHRFAGPAFKFKDASPTRDGLRVLSASDNGGQYWEVATGRVLKELPGPHLVLAVALAPDEKTAAVASIDGFVVWDLEAAKVLRHLDRPGAPDSIAYSDDGTRLEWLSSSTNEVCESSVRGGDAPACHELKDVGRIDPSVTYPNVSLTGGRYGELALWDTHTGRLLVRFAGLQKPIDDVALAPRAHLVASAAEDHTIRLWSTRTGKEIAQRRGLAGFGVIVDLSTDGRRVLYYTEDGTIRIWSRACAGDWTERNGRCAP